MENLKKKNVLRTAWNCKTEKARLNIQAGLHCRTVTAHKSQYLG